MKDKVKEEIEILRHRLQEIECCCGTCSSCEHFAGIKDGRCSKFESSLIQEAAHIEDRDDNGDTPVLATAKRQSNKFPIISFVKAGANLFAQDKHGRSLLHCSLLNENTEVTKFLLSAPYLTSDKDDSGFSLLESMLLEGKNPEILRLILEKQKEEHIQLARRNPNPEILAELKKLDYKVDEEGEPADSSIFERKPDSEAGSHLPSIYHFSDTLLENIAISYTHLKNNCFFVKKTVEFEVPFRRAKEALRLTTNEAALFIFMFVNFISLGGAAIPFSQLADDANTNILRFLSFHREVDSLIEKGMIDYEDDCEDFYLRKFFIPSIVIDKIIIGI